MASASVPVPDPRASGSLSGPLRRWLDAEATDASAGDPEAIDWLRVAPFVALHLGCLGVIWVGWSAAAVLTALGLYWARMFAITGFYHRYFSHRSFKASRPVQFLMAVAGCTAIQRGPLWWAAHHRHHHRHADQHPDFHSPLQKGFWIAHCGWFLTRRAFATQERYVRDWVRYPELRWLNRYDWAVGAALGLVLLAAGGWQLVVWGFCISTVVCYHGTYTINSLAHAFGSRRFNTGDGSRNSLILALLTLGEGWHNNHHRYQAAARQGFYWWEVDITWYLLRLMSGVGLIRDLRPVPARVLAEGRP